MHLPNADHAVVERRKVEGYLLAADHPEGSGKAAFFLHFGFAADRWWELAEAMLVHARIHQVSATGPFEYGTKFQVDGPMACPNGRRPMVRVIWTVEAGSHIPRLVTAYPL